MSTCRGCWGDGFNHLPGVVLCEPVSGWVQHAARPRCDILEPHPMAQCGEFDPPRTAAEIAAQETA